MTVTSGKNSLENFMLSMVSLCAEPATCHRVMSSMTIDDVKVINPDFIKGAQLLYCLEINWKPNTCLCGFSN